MTTWEIAIVAASAASWCVTGTALLNAVAGPFLRSRRSVQPMAVPGPRVSLLIPARNEEAVIGRALKSATALDWPDLEIVVLDDDSDDATGSIAAGFALRDSRVRVVRGNGPRPGWTGKNYACHQLATHATGEVLIFTDADNWCDPRAVANSVEWLHRWQLGFLSAFPQQHTVGIYERLVVPVVDLFVYALLPLWLVPLLPFPSMSAANGQWMVFRRSAYDAAGGHQAVRSAVVEDIAFARRLKTLGIRTMTLAGTGMVYARMYGSRAEVVEGFSKNLFGLTNYSIPVFVLLFLFLAGVWILPFAALGISSFQLPFAIVLALPPVVLRAVAWMRWKHPVEMIILHPVSFFFTAYIAIRSAYLRLSKRGVSWKGRRYQ